MSQKVLSGGGHNGAGLIAINDSTQADNAAVTRRSHVGLAPRRSISLVTAVIRRSQRRPSARMIRRAWCCGGATTTNGMQEEHEQR